MRQLLIWVLMGLVCPVLVAAWYQTVMGEIENEVTFLPCQEVAIAIVLAVGGATRASVFP